MVGGILVEISNLRIQGARPDGSADPGEDMVAIVDFDPVAAGCDVTSGYCTPGAEIQFYLNGQILNDETASGYDESLGGYSVSSSGFTAPSSGIMKITAISMNNLEADVQVASTGEEPGEGFVAVNSVNCGNSPYFNCSCEANGELILYVDRTVVSAGGGTAYMNVFVDGSPVATNVPTSTAQGGRAVDSVSINCPNLSTNHTIVVQGQNGDPGASIVLAAGTPLGGNYTGSGQTPLGGAVQGNQSTAVSTTLLSSVPNQQQVVTQVSRAAPTSDNQTLIIAGVVIAGMAVAAVLLATKMNENDANDADMV